MPPAESSADEAEYDASRSTTAMRIDGCSRARWKATEDPTTPPPTMTTSKRSDAVVSERRARALATFLIIPTRTALEQVVCGSLRSRWQACSPSAAWRG